MSVASTLDLSPYAAAQHLSILCLDFVECRTLTPACSTTPLDAHRHSDGHGTLDELRVVTRWDRVMQRKARRLGNAIRIQLPPVRFPGRHGALGFSRLGELAVLETICSGVSRRQLTLKVAQALGARVELVGNRRGPRRPGAKLLP